MAVGGEENTGLYADASTGPVRATAGPLVAHLIFRLAVGGLENGLVNLINRLPESRYRHVVLCLGGFTDFRNRILRKDVRVIDLRKRAGLDLACNWRLLRLLKQLRPSILHTRNYATLEYQAVGLAAGVGARVHGEHGWDVHDLAGTRWKYRALRKAMAPLVHRFIAVSSDLEHYLADYVHIRRGKIMTIHNGVDTRRFAPGDTDCRRNVLPTTWPEDAIVIGTVGRMQTVKDQITLLNAFLGIIGSEPVLRQRLRLVMVGDGPLRDEALRTLDQHDATQLAWVPGERADIPEILRALDVFVLPSLNEGISNTILEAMATGLPVIATRVGGNAELVIEGRTGLLVAPRKPDEMGTAIMQYTQQRELRLAHGTAARDRVKKQFDLDVMANRYLEVYDELISRSERP